MKGQILCVHSRVQEQDYFHTQKQFKKLNFHANWYSQKSSNLKITWNFISSNVSHFGAL